MKKYLLIFSVIALFLTSCNNTEKVKEAKNDVKKEAKKDAKVAEEPVKIAIADFDSLIGKYVGKKVIIKGTVDHICKHGGQKLFLVSENSDARVKVTPDEEIAAFNAELEGERMMVTGVVEEQRVDEAYLKEWEEEIKAGADLSNDKGEGKHLGGKMEKGGEESDVAEEMQKVNHLRKMIEESGDDHISFYSITCTSFKVDGK